MPIDIKLEGIEDIRRLSAALEQYNAKAGACAADYKATAEEAARAVCILRGEPVAPRLPSQPISVLESAAQEASEAVYNQKSAIRVLGGALYVGGVEWVQDVARLVRDTSTAIRHLREETTPADTTRQSPLRDAVGAAVKVIQNLRDRVAARDKEVARLMDTVRRCDITHEQQAETIRAEREKIDQLRADAVQMAHRATLAESASRGHVEEIERMRGTTAARDEHIAALQLQLAAREEELKAAEAEIAKRDPLIKAIREGHVYAAFGEWVVPRSAATEPGRISIYFDAGDKKCL